ncbi:probable palmitoyltransferase ZDHHC24 isoform X2 [Desmodus rotundus]|uniref:probable palmitoyltransferase ZDHHC24 isoform X2 n=1 Tax=Desmodus rotundus TaxID=9430 RepID=UPI002380ECE2|nr:probable palmitoyltransferase ZDHHC24 isoform X2 [Desmodus rotundus]
MGQPWAVGRTEGAPGRLPLVLTALWAAAVGLELAYVLVLGPGPPPLGPLARALQLALAAFQLLNLLGNVGLFLRSDPSIRGVMLAGRGLGQGWAYCYQCQSQVPPRSGHCSACRICILRRDHHCRLLGRCVGFRNYRPFLCLLLHASGVLLHVSVLLGPALAALLQSHTPLHTATLLLLPWLMLLTGRVSLAQFALAFVTDTCVAGAGLTQIPDRAETMGANFLEANDTHLQPQHDTTTQLRHVLTSQNLRERGQAQDLRGASQRHLPKIKTREHCLKMTFLHENDFQCQIL